MQRIHLVDGVEFLDGAEFLLAKELRELYLDFEGLEVTVADTLEEGEEDDFEATPYRTDDETTLFIPFQNVRAYDSVDDEYVGDVITRDKMIQFRHAPIMIQEEPLVADKIVDRPPGVKIVCGDEEFVVPQSNLAAIQVDENALKQG